MGIYLLANGVLTGMAVNARVRTGTHGSLGIGLEMGKAEGY